MIAMIDMVNMNMIVTSSATKMLHTQRSESGFDISHV